MPACIEVGVAREQPVLRALHPLLREEHRRPVGDPVVDLQQLVTVADREPLGAGVSQPGRGLDRAACTRLGQRAAPGPRSASARCASTSVRGNRQARFLRVRREAHLVHEQARRPSWSASGSTVAVRELVRCRETGRRSPSVHGSSTAGPVPSAAPAAAERRSSSSPGEAPRPRRHDAGPARRSAEGRGHADHRHSAGGKDPRGLQAGDVVRPRPRRPRGPCTRRPCAGFRPASSASSACDRLRGLHQLEDVVHRGDVRIRCGRLALLVERPPGSLPSP